MGKTYIISEIGLNHNGSLELAKEMIDASNFSGADAVKFQKRNVKTLATENILNAEDNRFPEFGKTYGDIRRHLEFNKDEYLELKQYSESKGLDFFVTAFDTQSVDFLLGLRTQSSFKSSHAQSSAKLNPTVEARVTNIIARIVTSILT